MNQLDYNRAPNESGAALLEFAVSGSFFLTLVILSIQTAGWTYNAVVLEFVANRAVRWATLGQTIDSMTREESILKTTRELAAELGVKLDSTPETIVICPLSDSNCSENNAAGPGELIVLKIRQPLFNYLPYSWVGNLEVSAFGIGRNEEYR